ncbi:MAG: hypothetical protein LBL31_02455, partial [Spirochaetaceae bacterium]|nr:hypothetical protein [Spirochaetaceae bacterium]
MKKFGEKTCLKVEQNNQKQIPVCFVVHPITYKHIGHDAYKVIDLIYNAGYRYFVLEMTLHAG